MLEELPGSLNAVPDQLPGDPRGVAGNGSQHLCCMDDTAGKVQRPLLISSRGCRAVCWSAWRRSGYHRIPNLSAPGRSAAQSPDLVECSGRWWPISITRRMPHGRRLHDPCHCSGRGCGMLIEESRRVGVPGTLGKSASAFGSRKNGGKTHGRKSIFESGGGQPEDPGSLVRECSENMM